MIGFYDYTVWLTYLSMLSGTAGIMLCLNGIGHPYIGMFFLMFSGLCDAFDGKVARTKKNRTETMKKFGIQIDSLADLICFGVLPACIGIAMMRSSISYETLMEFRFLKLVKKPTVVVVILTVIAVFYVLAALIRLAYFNVTEEELKNVVIAYEPVWAIGTGKTATADQAEEVCAFIRATIAKLYNQAAADAVTIQYGGSMNDGNADELLSKTNVDGGLIGGASLVAEKFAAIVKAASK